MEFWEVVERRRSVRAFTDQPVEAEKLQRILEAANAAPSAGNLQAYEIIKVKDRATLQALVEAAWGQEFIAQAPVALVFCADARRSAGRYGSRGANLYCLQDATIACAYAQLAATALGLATVWVGAYDDEAVSRVLRLGSHLRPVAILPIGYAAESPAKTPRRPLQDLVRDFPQKSTKG